MKIKNLRLFALLLFAMVMSSSIPVKAQVVELFKNIHPTSGSMTNDNHTYQCMDKMFFTANDGTHGVELWISDGTDAGTQLLKDIIPGTASSEAGYSGNFAFCNNKLFFIANDGIHGAELWATDGTESGTYMIKDILPGIGLGIGTYTSANQLYTYNGKVYFCGNDGDPLEGGHAGELWCSDGTEVGTYMVKDIRVNMDYGTSFSSASGFKEFNGLLYFAAYDGSPAEGGHANELWVTDGTEAGTHLFIDIAVEQYSDIPANLTVVGDKLFFTHGDSLGNELWVTDGTVDGTHLTKDINTGTPGSSPKYLTVFDSILYFRAFSENNGVFNNELWRSDGTTEGTYRVFDQDIYDPINITVYHDKLIFLAFNGVNNLNYEVWSWSITGGLTLIKEINPSETFGMDFNPESNLTDGFYLYNDKLYFRADDGSIRLKMLWETDGTDKGTKMVDGQPTGRNNCLGGFCDFQVYYGSLYYPAWYVFTIRREPYKLTTLPLTDTVVGGGEYCQSGEGLSVDLSGSYLGVTYTLYKDSIAQTPTIVGTGEPISFGNQLAGTYTVTGTNIAGTVDMIGSAVIIETPLLPISVTIEADGNNFCGPTEVTLTATTVNAGDSPVYYWYLNEYPAGSDQPTFTYTPANNDEVYVVITSDQPCTTGSPAASNFIVFNVVDQVAPAVTITASENPVFEGVPVTFTPAPENGGAPTYLWYVNDNLAGDESSFTYNPGNGDHVYAKMASSLECTTADTVLSNTVVMDVITSVDFAGISNLKVYCFDKVLTIENSSVLNGEVSIYDLVGRKITALTLLNETHATITVNNLVSGTYIVSVITDKGRTNTKVFIQ